MSDLTVQERVVQAVTRTYELIAERGAATAALQAAKQQEDRVRLDPGVAIAKKGAAAVLDVAFGKAEGAFHSVMDGELDKLEKVQARYNLVLSQHEQVRTTSKAKAQVEYDRVVKEAQQEHEMNMATAHATVFRGEKEIAAIQTTIDQHKRQVLESFGIDIGKLVV